MITLTPQVRLASWLLQNHPEIFKAIQQQAQQSGFARFGDGETTTFDSSLDTFTPDLVDTSSLVLDPGTLSTPSLDWGSLATPSFNVDTTSSGGFFSTLTSGLSSVASFLGSATGLTALTSVAKAAFGSGSAQAQTIGTQTKLVANGQNPAPISYGVNAAGQVVPIYTGTTVPGTVAATGSPAVTTAGVAGISLTSAGLSSLLSSKALPWVLGIVAGGLLLASAGRGKRR